MKKNKVILLCLIIIMISSVIVAFKSIDQDKGLNISTHSTQSSNSILPFMLNDMPVNIDYSTRDTWYDMPMMTTEFEMELKVPNIIGYKFEVNFKEVTPGEVVPIKLDKLTKDSGIAIHITKKGDKETHKYAIRSLNNFFPYFDIYSSQSYLEKIEDAYYYFNCENFIIKMNKNGEIVFYKNTPEVAIDFKRTEIDGITYYSYIQRNAGVLINERNMGYNPGFLVVMDEKYNIIDTVSDITINYGNKEVKSPLDFHDAIILGKGHYVVQSYVKQHVENIPEDTPHPEQGSNILSGVIQEIKDGKILFQWNSADYSELFKYSNIYNDYYNRDMFYSDYIHLNSMDIDKNDNNLILSLRNLDSIIKIDRNSGKILWILSGSGDEFGLLDNQKTKDQHFARYTDNGSITVFDNQLDIKNKNLENQSFIKEYRVDEKNKKLISYNEFKVDGRYSPIMGSATRLDTEKNVFLIGWGGRNSSTALFSVEDFDSNKTLFEVNYNKNLLDGFSSNSYRVYKDIK